MTNVVVLRPTHAGLTRFPRRRTDARQAPSSCNMEGHSGEGLRRQGRGAMASDVHFGNAGVEGDAHRGWFVGHFIPEAERLRHEDGVEVKWGVHPAGEERPSWVVNAVATTLSLLVRGRFRLYFPTTEYLLQQEGDYVLWSPGV